VPKALKDSRVLLAKLVLKGKKVSWGPRVLKENMDRRVLLEQLGLKVFRVKLVLLVQGALEEKLAQMVNKDYKENAVKLVLEGNKG